MSCILNLMINKNENNNLMFNFKRSTYKSIKFMY